MDDPLPRLRGDLDALAFKHKSAGRSPRGEGGCAEGEEEGNPKSCHGKDPYGTSYTSTSATPVSFAAPDTVAV
jgi:hypothetical protein